MNVSAPSRKNPEAVRLRLLDAAACLIANRGFCAVSLNDIAEAAGITKGGLFHHFQGKEHLLTAMFENELESLDSQIDTAVMQDGDRYGVFTRAYIRAAFTRLPRHSPWTALTFSAGALPGLADRWTNWIAARLVRHQQTDSAPELETVRLAADGFWLTSLLRQHNEEDDNNRARIEERLISMTFSEEKRRTSAGETPLLRG
ncbi:TetR/AcrR family transcriptional regulator [Pectobacterium jejuense]|uniref:TetR/AcrR family transcriptional regulator n=1 Tax=Pectobacterium TaxID=122277 RepID=UPI00227DA216|nr:TetR/AcrR family transcriptional regulator [Pectobacterium jejuense]MCY9848896.1 TetR/AcrR family transcriptional regulator [Pectobacterium jejuense]